jgi:hypothetical protein
VPSCVLRARSGVHAVMIAHCAVVAAVRDVVRACGACVSVFCMRVCDVRCVGCMRALFWMTRAMTLPCRCGGCGLSHLVCLCLCVSVCVCVVLRINGVDCLMACVCAVLCCAPVLLFCAAMLQVDV